MPLEWAFHMDLPVVIVPQLPPTQTMTRTTNKTAATTKAAAETTNPAVVAPMDVAAVEDAMESGESDFRDADEDQTRPNGRGGSGGGDKMSSSSAINAANTDDADDNGARLFDYACKVGLGALKAKRVNGHLWILVPLPNTVQEALMALQQWSTLDTFLNHPGNVGLLLDFHPPLSASGAAETSNNNHKLSPIALGKLQVVFLHHLIGMATICGVRFSCSHFLTNKSGYPTLSRGVQFVTAWLLQRLGGRSLRLLVQGPATHFNGATGISIRGATDCLPYLQYLQHLRKRPEVCHVLDSKQARLEEDHCDRLQRPLQPLRDHLDNSTYEVFEKDPIKYREYQRAISMAITDFATSGPNAATRRSGAMVVLVVGAGRGPLVSCVVQAFESMDVNQRPQSILLWAVEKNPSAVIYLQSLIAYQQQKKWQNLPVRVQLVHSDLRHLSASIFENRQADLIVSELLGSFGDNELSPECLDALFTQTNVCHEDTVSIPTRYTAYLAPVSSIKLHQKVQEQALYPNETEGMNGMSAEGSGVLGTQVATETPYVVRPRGASQMGPSLPCWTFAHPNVPQQQQTTETPNFSSKANELNRSVHLEFRGEQVPTSARWGPGYGPLDERVVAMLDGNNNKTTTPTSTADDAEDASTYHLPWSLTGFLGTFSADLYIRRPVSSLSPPEIVRISTVPDGTFSTGMFSWFPLYFPLDKPVLVPGGKHVSVYAHMARYSSAKDHKVWYEWSAVVQDKSTSSILGSTTIHNPRGRSFFASSL